MNSSALFSKALGSLLTLTSLIAVAPADQAPLTAAQVAQLAYTQGFRGGSLVAAVAVASAESSFDPDAVCNNLQEINASGQPLYYPNGKPRITALPYYDGTMLPLNQVMSLSGGGQGKVISHCRGLWQINNTEHSTITNADAFNPSVAVRRAWGISRGGRFWCKWTSVMTGTAWQSTRLTAARTAARAVDPTVLQQNVPAGTRVRAWTTGGGVRSTAAGTFLRSVRQGDTGTLLAGPVIASFTQNLQTSQHLWYQVQWDHGTTGWCTEEYLTQSTLPVQTASPAFNPLPENGKVRVPISLVDLEWSIGANTKEVQLRFGTDSALNTPDTLKLNGGLPTKWTTSGLQNYRDYYWRVDSVNANGTILQGPTWTFRTIPIPPQPVVLSNITIVPKPAGRGQMITISGLATSPGPQSVIIGADIGTYSDPTRDLVFSVPGSNVATQFSRSFLLPADIPFGSYNITVAAWQDLGGSGTIDSGDVRIHQLTVANGVVVGDVTQPTLTNLSATSATNLPNQTVQLAATASDSGGSGLTGVYFYRGVGETTPSNWQVVAYRAATGNGPVTFTAQDIPPAEGRYWYEMEAVDASNNRRRLAAPAPLRIQIPDLAPPVVKWTNPTNGMSVNGGTTVTGQATDDRSVTSLFYRINGGAWVQVFQNFNNWSVYMNLQPGSNLIEARAIDQAGKSSAIEPLYLYNSGTGIGTFDEQIAFDNQLGQQWQLDSTGPSFDNGIVNGRLQATSDNTASIRATKAVPAGVQELELRFAAQGPAGLYWQDNAFRQWRIAQRPNQSILEVGYNGALQNLALPGGSGQLSKIRTLWRDGRLRIEYFPQGSPTPTTYNVVLPLLRLSNLTGQMEFRVESSFSVTSAIDDIQLRGLRYWDRFSINSLTLKPGQSSKVRWTSFAGRNYAIETSPTLNSNSWNNIGQVFSNGLVTEHTFTMPSGRRQHVRVRELP